MSCHQHPPTYAYAPFPAALQQTPLEMPDHTAFIQSIVSQRSNRDAQSIPKPPPPYPVYDDDDDDEDQTPDSIRYTPIQPYTSPMPFSRPAQPSPLPPVHEPPSDKPSALKPRPRTSSPQALRGTSPPTHSTPPSIPHDAETESGHRVQAMAVDTYEPTLGGLHGIWELERKPSRRERVRRAVGRWGVLRW